MGILNVALNCYKLPLCTVESRNRIPGCERRPFVTVKESKFCPCVINGRFSHASHCRLGGDLVVWLDGAVARWIAGDRCPAGPRGIAVRVACIAGSAAGCMHRCPCRCCIYDSVDVGNIVGRMCRCPLPVLRTVKPAGGGFRRRVWKKGVGFWCALRRVWPRVRRCDGIRRS